MSFQELSREIVQEFLQTVVVVDDHAYLHTEDESISEKPEPILEPMVAISFDSKDDIPENGQAVNHPLNAKILIDKFAEKGQVCAVLRVEKNEEDIVVDKAVNAAKRSDLIILDWKIHSTYGDTTKKIIQQIVMSDKESNRLRFIAIYTGEDRLEQYIDEIKQSLETLGLSVYLNEDKLSLQCQATFITIFVKDQTGVDKKLFEHYSDRLIMVERLPEVLINQFAAINYGLIPAVALESISSIRNSTHMLLGKFHKFLDAPFLAHKVLLDNPKEAKDHLTSLIAEELNAIIHDYEVGAKILDVDNLVNWANENEIINNNFIPNLRDSEKFKKLLSLGLTNEEVKTIDAKLRSCAASQFSDTSKIFSIYGEKLSTMKALEAEIDVAKAERKRTEEEVRTNSTDETIEERTKAAKHCSFLEKKLKKMQDESQTDEVSLIRNEHNFASLMSMLSRYKRPIPYLRLGVIIKRIDNGMYYLCLQPRCDSVHITDEKRAFPFFPLEPNDQPSKFDIAIYDGEKPLYGKLFLDPYKCEMFEFSPSGEELKILPNGDNIFISNTGNQFQYISELKPNFAQDIANRYATKISRVGLNKSEWHRRWE